MICKIRNKQIIGLVLILLLLVGCGGGIKQMDDIKKGMLKNDIVESLGKPNEWVTLTSNMQMSVAAVFDLESTKRSMPAGEVWLFEYTLPNEGTFTIHFQNDAVVDVVKGPALKE